MLTLGDKFTSKMIVNINVFCSFVCTRILTEEDCTVIIRVKNWTKKELNPKFPKQLEHTYYFKNGINKSRILRFAA